MLKYLVFKCRYKRLIHLLYMIWKTFLKNLTEIEHLVQMANWAFKVDWNWKMSLWRSFVMRGIKNTCPLNEKRVWFFTFHEKRDKLDCHNYHGIILLNEVFKIFTNILLHRFLCVMKSIGKYQCGIMKGKIYCWPDMLA